MGIRISKDHLHPSVIESITSLIGDLSQLETTAKGNAVEAINELLANGGNKEELEALIAEIAEGKELIANAVGEPLTAEDSFDEMSNDINSLLSQFKTNMMNNGVTVESGDKFKQLIDKISTMVEEGSGKGIQMVSGTVDLSIDGLYTVDDLSFKPSIIIIGKFENDAYSGLSYNEFITSEGYTGAIGFRNPVDGQDGRYYTFERVLYETDIECYVNNTGFKLYSEYYNFLNYYEISPTNFKYYAIGIGEEDTTLRDSLASILQEEGVSVTEEDDMASLITKVDEEFKNKNANKGLAVVASADGVSDILFHSLLFEDYNNDFIVQTLTKTEFTAEAFICKYSGEYLLNLTMGSGSLKTSTNTNFYAYYGYNIYDNNNNLINSVQLNSFRIYHQSSVRDSISVNIDMTKGQYMKLWAYSDESSWTTLSIREWTVSCALM